jgi:excisionase family DNA binding protein
MTTVDTKACAAALPPKPLSRAEAAAYLSISSRTLDRMVRTKAVRAYQVGRRVLIDTASIRALLEKANDG